MKDWVLENMGSRPVSLKKRGNITPKCICKKCYEPDSKNIWM
jgi:hypothetical protein